MKIRIKNNPFNSQLFERIWAEFYELSDKLVTLTYIKNLKFFKHKFLPIYYNLGRNHTNGISYILEYSSASLVIDNHVILIKDIPTYFEIEILGTAPKNLKSLHVRQYKGYLANFKNVHSLEDYFEQNFSPKTKSQLRRFSRKLESNHKVSFEVLYGQKIDKAKFDYIFDNFFEFLERRFISKEEYVHHLEEKNQAYIKSMFWELVPEKKAAIFVTYANGNPISINLNFTSKQCLFSFLPSFDIQYAKFKPGIYTIQKIFDWAIQHNFNIYDFSKGAFDYKERWCNLIYDFEYHIYYNSRSVISVLIANSLYLKYRVWQFLRDKNVHKTYRKLKFSIRNL